MRPLLLTGALLAVVAFAARAEDKDRLADEAKIQGTWAIISGESDGKAVPDDKIKDSAVVIGKDSLHVRDGKNNKTWMVSYRLDPTKDPKTITMALQEGDMKGKTAEGIYRLEGDSLKLCYALPGEARPVGFSTKEGGHQNCFTLKRIKEK